jgi:type IV pilus assembly protein PilM
MSTFTRDITVGGNRYTEAIQKDFGLTYEDAERVKRGDDVDGVDREQASGVISSVTEDIVAEIQRSFEFFRSTSGNEKVEQVLLSGGCARIRNFSAILGERLEVPVEITNPFKNVRVDPKKFNPAFMEEAGPMAAVAVGLAIRRPGDR